MTTPVAGAAYVESISRRGSDQRTRAAFQTLAMALVGPGAPLFDFGCGPGIDAQVYAARGIEVEAYDVDPVMCAYFADACRDEIGSGRVVLNTGAFESFVAAGTLPSGRSVALVTANFAPLNLVPDLGALFRCFHSLTCADGKVLASVLSPYYVGDTVYLWWWKNLIRLQRHGRFSVAGDQAPITRRTVADFAAHAEPYFTLTDAWPGRPSAVRGAPAPAATRPAVRRSHGSLALCRFMFLLFERNAPVAHRP